MKRAIATALLGGALLAGSSAAACPEEHERGGTFEIRDPELRKRFWHYYTDMPHNELPADAVDFSTPWWVQGLERMRAGRL
jgi:hypothetical protein